MATYTSNIGLKKPELTDLIKLSDFNGNYDILDQKIGAVPSGENVVGMIGAIIDDDAGEGNTAQTWSADKILTDIHSVPAGGTASQVLAKASNDDHDLMWVDQTGGGGGGDTNFNNLSNKPKLNNVTIIGSQSSDDFGLLQKGSQTLTDAEKTQVRTNLGAAADSDVSDINNRLTNLFKYTYYTKTIASLATGSGVRLTAEQMGFITPSGYKPFALARYTSGQYKVSTSYVNIFATGDTNAIGIFNSSGSTQTTFTVGIGILYVKTGFGI